MTLSRTSISHAFATTAIAATLLGSPTIAFAQSGHAGHDMGTPSPSPAASWSCDMTTGMGGMDMGTPMGDHDMSTMDMDYPFDQLYIDMMIPHHQSIIALAEAALPRLTDPRLIQMAENIISAQTTENTQMSAWREAWYGSPDVDMSETSMNAMLEAMPVATTDEMMREMDPTAQVATFCTAENPDLAFIDQAIPHHQMAVDVSVIALEKAEHPEIRTTAAAVIAAQQAEIDHLNAIRADLTGEAPATPAG
jgi:uncharacterized protein (DUF305 family)